jgi:dolichol-phosphate mannosyltransferase
VSPEPTRFEPRVSIVVPVLDEEQVLPLLLPRLRAAMDALPGGAEVWFVRRRPRHDPSSRRRTGRPRSLQLSRNFGPPAAMTAGLDHAGGDAVVVMDADLQDPPELIPEMVALFRRGFDVVHARRSARRGESAFKRATAWLFYRLMRAVTENEIESNVGEFRLMSRKVVDAMRGLRERHRLMRGLVSWVGFAHTTIEFERPERAAGGTKYSLAKMVRLSLDAMTSFSAIPLRLATLLGFLGLVSGRATRSTRSTSVTSSAWAPG